MQQISDYISSADFEHVSNIYLRRAAIGILLPIARYEDANLKGDEIGQATARGELLIISLVKTHLLELVLRIPKILFEDVPCALDN